VADRLLHEASVAEAPPTSLARLQICRPYMPGTARILPYLEQIESARWYSNYGPLISQLESRLAARLDQRASVTSLCNATSGIALSLRALGAAQGSLCILPSWTFVASAHAVVQAGLIPWFHDVDPDTWMLDPNAVMASLKTAPSHVGAILPIAAFGHMPDTCAWADFNHTTGIPVLLDAAAAFDGLRDARIPAVVSLHATKVLGAGEGGYLATVDTALSTAVRRAANFSFSGNRIAQCQGGNSKLSEYAAAVGLASLDNWPTTRALYMRVAGHLRAACSELPGIGFQPGWGTDWISSVCVVRVPDGKATEIGHHLEAAGIETRQWWGEGCHASPAFSDAPKTTLKATEHLARSTIGLPFAADFTNETIQRIANALAAALRST
jgi:dTDP-4-amino-4,6-dideoxygalactose transaminase